MKPRQIDAEINRLKNRLKRIEDILELSPIVADFKGFTERDQKVLRFLLDRDAEGATLQEIAEYMSFKKPESNGKVQAHRVLKHIQRHSLRTRGFPMAVSDRRRWYINKTDFTFQVKNSP